MIEKLRGQTKSLLYVLELIDAEQYIQSIHHLSGSTIGQHTRHCIEMIKCLITGSAEERVDYVNRVRNLQLEQNIHLAKTQLILLLDKMDEHNYEKPLILTADEISLLSTTFQREVHFLVEHTIHHLALIKVALIELDIKIVDPDFGVGYSTILYRKSLEMQRDAKELKTINVS